jgi:RNA-dependent RNA polymerase
LTATYIDGLEEIVGDSKYAIFFPTSGSRSLADEMANSDFDGDMYWVSWNPQVALVVKDLPLILDYSCIFLYIN